MSAPLDLNQLICSGKATETLNSYSQLLIPFFNQDFEVTDLTKTAELGVIALSKETLLDKNAPALLVYHAAKNLLSDRMAAYEPETIWLELEHLGLDISEENRNKLLMVNAIHVTDPIVYDVHVFKNMVLIFNNEIPNLDMTEEVTPEQIAWAMINLQLIHPNVPIYMDYEPRVFTAVVLHRAGFMLAPDTLKFAQKELDRLNYNIDIKSDIQKALNNKTLDSETTIVKNQVNKLDRVKEYLKTMYSDYKHKLNQFLEPSVTGEKLAKLLKKKEELTDRKTGFTIPELGFGSIRGNEKSGVEDPMGHGGKIDYVPPVFVLNAEGA